MSCDSTEGRPPINKFQRTSGKLVTGGLGCQLNQYICCGMGGSDCNHHAHPLWSLAMVVSPRGTIIRNTVAD